MASLQACLEEWDDLNKEFAQLEELHKNYCKKVEEVKAVQQKCQSGISHQRYRMKRILESLREFAPTASEEERKKMTELKQQFTDRKTDFRELEETLPHENGLYLKVILGSVNVSLLSKRDKYKYKENYETFKLYVTLLSFVVSLVLWFIPPTRVMDAAFQFLLVWYYCTLTIREHILKVNGSRIKGWWISHHFISTVCAGILLIWPEGYTYNQFREQFVVFSMYITIVQVAQYYYQKGCLYRLRALGERHNMDLTVEGFQSWMWKGLSFVLPFLLMGYLFQFYNAWVLYWLSQHEQCSEWQVWTLAVIFFSLFLGNTLTTTAVIRQKISRSGWMEHLEKVWQNKYKFNHSQSAAQKPAENKPHGS